jgi:antitoxin FitA
MNTASILIRDLPLDTKQGLRLMAQAHQHSMEEEARQILRAAVSRARKKLDSEPASIGHRIHARFAALGGLELQTPARETWRDLPVFAQEPAAKPKRRK